MNQNTFEQLRDSRRHALVAATRQPERCFTPYRDTRITSLCFDLVCTQRGMLRIELADGSQHDLPGFCRRDAEQLRTLTDAQWPGFLRDVWLNYLAWRCAH